MVCRRRLLRILVSVAFIAIPVSPGVSEDKLSFSQDIHPILSDRCFVCHGPDASRREADLRLDLEEAAKDYVIVPGEPNDSELVSRIASDDPDLRMPPAGTKLSLTAEEIERIRRWVEQGAAWDQHWSFVPPKPSDVPQVDNDNWAHNAIDRFVLHRLEEEGLQPAPTACRETLIRRVTFDLTGLPPTLDELDAFLADSSPESFERVVDRLLASPRFGERVAADWLDAARYSDSYGYQVDRDRYVWPWRDWVVDAINRNLPYDQFITQQLAGDLLPNADDQTILATTFNRLHPQKVEGGSVPEEFRKEYVADRTQTIATAFLGLTMECCRCHDHKYDPISQREYYSLSAFFDNIDEAGLYSYFTNSVPTPTLLLADDVTKQKLADAEAAVQQAEQRLKSLATKQDAGFQQWLEASPRPEPETDAKQDSEPHAQVPGRIAYLDFEQPAKAPNETRPGKIGNAVKLTGDDGVGLKVGNFHRFDPFSVALWVNPPDEKERAVVFHRSRAWTDAASRGYELLIEDGRLSAALIHFWPGNAIRVRTCEKLSLKTWTHVAVTWDGSSRAEGLQIYVNGSPAETEVVRDNLFKNITGGGGDNISIGERFRDRGFADGLVDEFQVFARELTPIEVAQLHDGASLKSLMEKKANELSDAESERLRAYYLANVDDLYGQALVDLRAAREAHCKLADAVQEIMVMREMPESRPTYLLRRGAYDAPVELVEPGTPSALPPFGDRPRNRLGLAQWLTSPEHPLTSRVAVNRLWQMTFGLGLVRTPEDFGSQGDPPTHQELLDWLANDFIEHGWDVKRLVKQLVMSATYQQSSQASAELIARDPENRLLARSSSYRLPAEMLRDNALAVSDLLVDQIGGPPAKPYEVEVSFKPVGRDHGAGLYRRSLYTYWKRTAPAPAMMTLDAAKREVCRVRRERTSSPLQAFVLLNGTQFVEAARALSCHLLERHGDDASALLKDMFRMLSSRSPNEQELLVLSELFDQQLQSFRASPEDAGKYLDVGEWKAATDIEPAKLAAVATLANMLLSYDECVIRR